MSKLCHATFFDPMPYEDEDEDAMNEADHWMTDNPFVMGIEHDRRIGLDTTNGCWVRNWRLVPCG